MALFEAEHATAALDAILAQEREALLAGQFERLTSLIDEKDRLIARIERDGAAPTMLDRLRSSAAHNQLLLAAAARGVSAARERLSHLGVQPKPMRTYSKDGVALDLAHAQKPDVNRRA